MASETRLEGAAEPRERQRIRLLWLIDSLTFGGAEALVIPFAGLANDYALDLTVCSRTSIAGNPLESEIRDLGVEVVNLEAKTLRDLTAYRRLRHLIDSRRFDLVHAHLTYAAIWGAIASRQTGVPLIASLHVAPDATSGWKESVRRRLLVALLNRHASRVVLVSNALAGEWRSRTRLRPENIEVVHNGIGRAAGASPQAASNTAHEIRTAVREELGVEQAAEVVMCVSVLREQKGLNVLLRAAVPLLRTFPSCRLVIVGDGPSRGRLESLAGGLGIGGSVVWTGFRRDVDRLLAAADVFVLPTLHDAFPTAIIEAMAAAKPVIASAVGGVPEIVDSTTGVLVPPGDEWALTGAMRFALENPRWRESAGGAGARKAAAELSSDAWMERLRRLYDTVLEEARS